MCDKTNKKQIEINRSCWTRTELKYYKHCQTLSIEKYNVKLTAVGCLFTTTST